MNATYFDNTNELHILYYQNRTRNRNNNVEIATHYLIKYTHDTEKPPAAPAALYPFQTKEK